MIISLTHPVGYQPQDGAKFDVEFTKARGVYGDDAGSFRFELLNSPDGALTWGTQNVGSYKADIVIALLGHEEKQADIVKKVKCSGSHASRTREKAIREGWLKEKGGFTEAGQIKYGGIDISGFLD